LSERDIAFRVICANHVPDHATIARFRQNNERGLKELFCEVLRLCAEAGLLKVGLLALDGTKIRARASLEANRTYDYLREEVRGWLAEAKETDAGEDRLWGTDGRGDELPPELRRSEDRRRRIKECLERLDREARQAEEERRRRMGEREEEERRQGKKKRGRKPKSPEEVGAEKKRKAKANLTDPDSRIMKTRSGYIQGYNAQAMVTEDQVIVAAELTPKENDLGQLHPMIEQAKENLARVVFSERIGVVVADAGYFSEDNLKRERERGGGPELLIATRKDREQRAEPQGPEPEKDALPENATERRKMEHKLRTEEGRAVYKKRGQMVEPVFGQIKEGRGFRVFSRRGHPACRSEWIFVCAVHNLLKLWRFLASAAPEAS